MLLRFTYKYECIYINCYHIVLNFFEIFFSILLLIPFSLSYDHKKQKVIDPKYHISQSEIDKEHQVVLQSVKDPSQFQYLYDKYFEAIFRFVLRRIDDEQTTADIVSQVFYKALKNLKSYRYKGVPFSAWLYRIAANEVAGFYKSSKKKQIYSLEEDLLTEIVEENAEDIPIDHSALIEKMKSLSDTEVEVLELRFFEEKAFAEIAYILEITEANAKMRTYRALEKLRQALKKEV